MECELSLSLCSMSVVFALLLLVDNKLKHSDPLDYENYVNDRCEQWFQWRLYHPWRLQICSHEMGILFFSCLAVACLFWWVVCA